MKLHHVRIITPNSVIDLGSLSIADSRIQEISSTPGQTEADGIDGTGLTVLPGFIDLHVHGSAGADTMDATPEALQQMSAFFVTRGVTNFLATTWTDTSERILNALHNVSTFQQLQSKTLTGARLLGAHLEGPYLNPKKGGAQNNALIRKVVPEEATRFLDTGVIKLLALAPEFTENEWLITEAVGRGITVSAAHTEASYEDMKRAVQLGLRQTTHTFNAMIGLHHRDPGTVGAALTFPELNCELICDLIHVHPAAVKVLYACKSREHIVLITDAMRAGGMPAGQYQLTKDVTVTADETGVHLPDGNLAGSNLTMDRALRNFLFATGATLEEAWPVSSYNAARILGIEQELGSIEVGKVANLVLVDEQLQVRATIVEGQLIYSTLSS